MNRSSTVRGSRADRPSRRWLMALVLAAGCGGGVRGQDAATEAGHDAPKSEGGVEAHGDTTPQVDALNDARVDAGVEHGPDAPDTAVEGRPDTGTNMQTLCPAVIPALTVDSGTVNGVLKGASNNPAVSCGGGVPTLGPEAFFTLTLTQPVTVALTVTAPVDTLVAIRPGACTDTISEIACGESPLSGGDAGVPPGSGGGMRVSGVTTPLAAGTYTIVIDTLSLGTLQSAAFSLTVAHFAPAANASCATPTLLAAGATASAQSLDRGGAPRSVCGGAAQSSLFYTVGVPSGERLTARATPNGGDHVWMPHISAFTSCSTNTCVSQGHVVSGTTQQLDWINNSASWQLLYLSVSADGPVNGGTFDLSVSILDLFATCGRPMPVGDGTVLPNQDLSLASTPTSGMTCSGGVQRALYYSATLLPQQTINVSTKPSLGANNSFFPAVAIRTSCDSQTCLENGGSGTMFTNNSDMDMPILVEISSQQPQFVGAFDLSVSMPPPPAGVIVTPTSGLVTTESGGTATFTVALASPPSANVTIPVTSDTPTEGTATPATLQFTPDNWRTAQTVTVKGVDDQVADGPRDYMIVLGPATSDDGRYSGLDPDDVSVTNLDNDPGVAFAGTGDLVTSESGRSATFTVVLNGAPTSNVTMALSSNDIGEGTVAPAQLTFTTTNWNVPQTVTVTGVDDAVVDGTQAYTIVTGALASSDARYMGQNPPDVTAHNLDDDQAAVAVKIVSGDHVCGSTSSPFPIAVDSTNQLYLVMQCENGLWLTTSSDAGVTFSDPTLIPDTDLFGGSAQFLAGAPGFAYLLFSGNDGNVYFTRTADAGATWSSRLMVSNKQDTILMGAAEKTVLILTPGTDGTNQMVLSRSLDGGRSFSPKTLLDGQTFALTVEPDGRTAWTLATVAANELHKSTDAGATFQKVSEISQDINSPFIGHGKLFTFSGSLQIIDLADTTKVESSVDFINVPPFAMEVDDLDALGILDSDPNGHLRATRVVPGATPPTDGRVLGPGPSTAGIAALSRKAAAVAVQNGNLVLYTTIVW
jgi:hypothetical protein